MGTRRMLETVRLNYSVFTIPTKEHVPWEREGTGANGLLILGLKVAEDGSGGVPEPTHRPTRSLVAIAVKPMRICT
jgi:hypothetical protein